MFRLRPKQDYTLEWARQLERSRGHVRIHSRWDDGSSRFLIRGNSAGLLYLARDVITLAATVWPKDHPGSPEMDYEPERELAPGLELGLLDKDSVPFLVSISREPPPVPFETFEFQNPPFSGIIETEWRSDSQIRTFLEMDTFNILANQPALLSLAEHLVQLADEVVPPGQRVTYDRYPLASGSIPFSLEKSEFIEKITSGRLLSTQG